MSIQEDVDRWLQYAQELSKMIRLPAGEAIQVTTPSTPWDWGGRTPGALPYSQWSLLNVVPSTPQQQTNAHAAGGSSGFDHSYRVWMNSLAVGNLEGDNHYKQLQANAAAARRTYTEYYKSVQLQWKNDVPSGTPDFSTWLNQDGQYAQLSQIKANRQAIDNEDKQLQDYVNQIEAPTADILAAYEDKQYQDVFSGPGGNVTERTWTLGTGKPYAIDYITEITGGNFGGDAVNGNKASFHMDYESEKYKYEEHFATVDTGGWLDFMAFGLGGNRKEAGVWGESSDWSLDIEFQDVRTIPIKAGGWYSGVNAFKNGPYAEGFSKYKDGDKNYFFGAGGSLSRIYTGMVVAYRPKAVLKTWESYTDYVHSSWQAEGGVEIGPFVFGTEMSGESTSAKVEKEEDTLTLTSTASWPVILGMASSWTVPPGE
ncbi:hypothetical protein GTW20_22815 [Nocardiopsis alba]|uniref:Uncharacterized protein n=1 Tax=Nocardiopsis alba TaxID=53437 RepID=A0A7K2IYW1_9ACTN|nr:hypothetical protein [Nocardiopsis alba]MYR35014.1 hypothetical protein [Nocardiopsis alba]